VNHVTQSNSNRVSALPRVVNSKTQLRAELAIARRLGKSIGLVPTMGALHAGHLSLVAASCRECDFTVVTIFVNPTQFGPGEDFSSYPRSLEADRTALAAYAVDLVFAPAVEEVYGKNHGSSLDVGPAAVPFEGARRPGHFSGVATVVLKLFNLVMPEVAYFGRKDYQQSIVVRRLVDDLDLPIELRVCAIVRDHDGLALSSRNAYLSPAQRQQALVLSRSLRVASELVATGERRTARIIDRMREVFATAPEVKIDYIALVRDGTVDEVSKIDGPTTAVVAARVGQTRLIDNELIARAVATLRE